MDLDTLAQNASDHELGALLAALFDSGFDWDNIRFEGVRELYPERGELVRGLRIERVPALLAIVELNTGLLSRHSPLPDYFRDFGRRLHNPDAFVHFMGFWDSVLLRAFAYAAFPRLGAGRSRALMHGYRARLHLASPMSLSWLFRSAFPELRVEVSAATFRQRTPSGRARVGSTLDGRTVIGAEFSERRPGFRVRLFAESAASEGVLDWENETLERLDRIEPMLARVRRPLEVVLRFEQYRHGQTLVDARSERRQLGVRPWLRPTRGEQMGPGDVVVRAAFA
ncbi:MAG TPA: hypothetical protein VMG12_31750 [Polyangiaceae bacterium]|nr:hypothetical protein [Polyangiaceae bacterium]